MLQARSVSVWACIWRVGWEREIGPAACMQPHSLLHSLLLLKRQLLTDGVCGAAATTSACRRFATKVDEFYYIGVTGSKAADAGAFKLNIDNTAAAT